MAYWITRFGSTDLPTRAQTQDVGTGEARSGLVTLPDGSAFDARGTAPTRQTPWELSVSGAIEASTGSALYAAGTALYGLVGQSEYLYRSPDGGGTNSQQVRARCLRVDMARDVRHRLWLQPTIVFEVQEPAWRGTADVTTSGTMTTGGTLNVSNAGNAPVWDPVFTIVAKGSAITDLKIRHSTHPYAAELCFGTAYGTGTSGGTILANGTLSIDCAAYGVSNNGTDAYSRFELGGNHHIDGWACLRPSPSPTNWLVTFTGGGSAIVSCTYSSAYA